MYQRDEESPRSVWEDWTSQQRRNVTPLTLEAAASDSATASVLPETEGQWRGDDPEVPTRQTSLWVAGRGEAGSDPQTTSPFANQESLIWVSVKNNSIITGSPTPAKTREYIS